MKIQYIKKRNGKVVDFNPTNIRRAIEKAFISVQGGVDSKILKNLSDLVVDYMEDQFKSSVPTVEDVQDIVEHVLMKNGFYQVAKAYIIYRYEHTKVREEKKEELQRKLKKEGLYIIKRSGERELFSTVKLKRSLARSVGDIEKEIDIDEVVLQCRNELYEDITTKEIERTLIMVLRSWIEKDPAYSVAAARVLLASLYKEVIGYDIIDFSRLEEQHKAAFIKNIYRGVKMGKLDPRLLVFDLDKLAEELILERDNSFKYLGVQVLADRYFLRDPKSGHVLETPQIFWMRIAMGLAINEEQKELQTKRFYEIYSTLRFISSTPTLFHSGTVRPQLSSCYLNTVEDSLEHIFKSLSDNAQMEKWSGGVGTDWSNLRATGALIKGTGVQSQGVIPFLKIANDVTVAINRSGRRRGATCSYLETWHYDIEEFLELRKNTGDERRRTHDMNTANWIPDLFMKRVQADEDWSLFSPDETPDLHHIYGKEFEQKYIQYEEAGEQGRLLLYKKIKARDLWKKMLNMLYETGHPWITFKDPCNIRSPQNHVGVVHNSNLCTEITLNNSASEIAVCNLGSVNLAAHMKDGQLDKDLLKITVTTAMRMLDNVIDLNFYPTKEARVSNMRHRPVGLGIMGFQDALYMQDINFDSEEAVKFADMSMEAVSYYAILASSQLAKERGPYSSYKGSKWDQGIFPVDTLDLLEQERGIKIPIPREGVMDWTPVRDSVKMYGMRNSNCMAIAPTSNLANIAGCIPCIEPIYKNIYVKSNLSGDFIVLNQYLVQNLKEIGLWNKDVMEQIKFYDGRLENISSIPVDIKNRFKEVFEIPPKWLITAAAYRGKWIDQSQSLNIFYNGTSGKELSELYQYAWEMGLKTTYYLRTLGVSQVEKSTIKTQKFGSTHQRIVGNQDIISQQAHCRIDDPECESCQ